MAVEGDPWALTLVSFQYLINELNYGRYTGRTLLRYLQNLLTVHAGRRAALAVAAAQPLPAPQIIDVGGRSGGGGGVIVPRGRRQNDHEREAPPQNLSHPTSPYTQW